MKILTFNVFSFLNESKKTTVPHLPLHYFEAEWITYGCICTARKAKYLWLSGCWVPKTYFS